MIGTSVPEGNGGLGGKHRSRAVELGAMGSGDREREVILLMSGGVAFLQISRIGSEKIILLAVAIERRSSIAVIRC
jgi:hypothetical protein